MRKDCKNCFDDMHKVYVEKYPGASYCMFCGRYVGKNDYHATEPPTVIDKRGNVLGDTEERHPAYAQLNFHRQSGGYTNLYGSAIKHQETICMTISTSKKYSSKWSEQYFADTMPLIEVRMSQAQFAQAITSMNMGSGVPVTLQAVRGKQMPRCQEKTVSEKANDGLKDKFNELTKKITTQEGRIKKILNKKGGGQLKLPSAKRSVKYMECLYRTFDQIFLTFMSV